MYIGLHVLTIDGMEREITNIFVGENRERVINAQKYLILIYMMNILE